MNKIWLIIKREYLVRVRKRSFIVMTILGPILMASLIILPTYLTIQGKEERIIALNEKGDFFSSRLGDTGNIHFVKIPEYEVGSIKEDFSSVPYYAMLEINDLESFTLYSDQQVSLSVRTEIEKELSSIIERHKLTLAGIDLQILEEVETKTKIETIIIRIKSFFIL